MQVKRYNHNVIYAVDYPLEIGEVERIDGEYVKYTDYLKLQQNTAKEINRIMIDNEGVKTRFTS